MTDDDTSSMAPQQPTEDWTEWNAKREADLRAEERARWILHENHWSNVRDDEKGAEVIGLLVGFFAGFFPVWDFLAEYFKGLTLNVLGLLFGLVIGPLVGMYAAVFLQRALRFSLKRRSQAQEMGMTPMQRLTTRTAAIVAVAIAAIGFVFVHNVDTRQSSASLLYYLMKGTIVLGNQYDAIQAQIGYRWLLSGLAAFVATVAIRNQQGK